MELAGGELVGMEVIEPDRSMLVVSARGYGKRTANAAYNLQNRGGQGVINLRVTEKNGEVVGFRQVSDDDGILLITDSGRLIRTNARELREMGRATQGVKLMDLDESERIVDLAAIIESDDDDEEDEPS